MRLFSTCLTVALLGAASARASSNFPAVVKSDLGLTSTPGCDLCHFNGQTGMGTATTPVGKTLKSLGVSAGSASSLSAALTKMTTNKTDSDGDGVSDVDELKAGTNPNVANGAADGGTAPPVNNLPVPTYGCAAVPGVMPLVGLALLALAGRRGLRRERK
jgi:hypothetical protein